MSKKKEREYILYRLNTPTHANEIIGDSEVCQKLNQTFNQIQLSLCTARNFYCSLILFLY